MTCDVCGSYSDDKGIGPLTCFCCPGSLNRDSLFASVNSVVEELLESAPMNSYFHLDADERLDLCKRWSLQGRSLWLPRPGQTADEFLRGFEERDHFAFLRQCQHEAHFADVQKKAVPPNHIIKVVWGLPSCLQKKSLPTCLSI